MISRSLVIQVIVLTALMMITGLIIDKKNGSGAGIIDLMAHQPIT